MEFKKYTHSVLAGSQFTGLDGAGRFLYNLSEDSLSRTSQIIDRVMFSGGTESKDVTIEVTSENGFSYYLFKDTSITDDSIVILGSIPLFKDEYITVTTSGATAPMEVSVTVAIEA